jgi:hypothetical protein
MVVITAGSRITLMIRMAPPHVVRMRGSAFLGLEGVRDPARAFGRVVATREGPGHGERICVMTSGCRS